METPSRRSVSPGATRPAALRRTGSLSLRSSAAFLAMILVASACRPSPIARISPEEVAQADSAARRAIANERAIDVAAIPPHTLGVAPFRVSASDTLIAPLSYGLADLLMTDLARSSELRLVDRLQLDALMRELDLAKSGRVDSTTAPRLGRLVGARRMVLGTLMQGDSGQLIVGARIADASTREVRQAVSATAPLSQIFDAEKALAFQLFRELGINLTPAERAAVEQRPTQNVTAFLAYSRGVRHEVEGNVAAAAREYRSALRIDPSFGLAGARLGAARGIAAPQLGRVARVAVDRVNGTFTSPVGGSNAGGPVDPAFPASPGQTSTIIITITTPPPAGTPDP